MRTAQRWEEHLGLPVRRVERQGRRSRVFAEPGELRRWLDSYSLPDDGGTTRVDYRLVFEKSPDAILILEDDHRIVDANAAACALFGHPRRQVVGARLDDFVGYPRPDEVQALWRHFLAEGSLRGEMGIRRGNGLSVSVQFHARAHYRPGRHVTILRPSRGFGSE